MNCEDTETVIEFPEQSEPELQIVYVLTNPCMPGIVKIGRTTNLEARVASLSAPTSVPEPFTVAYAAYVEDSPFVERAIHAAFSMHRLTGKEFFRIPVANAIAALSLAEVRQVAIADDKSPDTFDILDEVKQRSEKRNSRTISKEGALADLLRLLDKGPIPSQDALTAIWGRPKSTVSDWMSEWRKTGLIPEPIREGRRNVTMIVG